MTDTPKRDTEAHIRELIAKAPPLTAAQKDTLRRLLTSSGTKSKKT